MSMRPRGVDTRRDAEGDVGGAGAALAIGCDAGQFHQRTQARLVGLPQFAQADRDNGAIFAGQRNGVCHRGNGGQLQQRRQQLVAQGERIDPAVGLGRVRQGSSRMQQRVRQLECDGRSAKVFVGVFAVGAGWD